MSESSLPVEETSPKKKWGFWKKAGVTLLALVLVAWGILWFYANRPVPELVISKETTYITEPLKSNGLPDYAAYLNAKFSKGVTPENNAFIPLLKAIGTDSRWPGQDASQTIQRLGVAAGDIPAQGVLIGSSEYCKPYEQDDDSATKPRWTIGGDYGSLECALTYADISPSNWTPALEEHKKQWVARNKKAIKLFYQAASRSRFYSPAETGDEKNIDAFLPSMNMFRDLARMVAARGALRLKAGDFEGAWADFLACKRVGRLISRDMQLIGGLVGVAVETLPDQYITEMLTDKRLTLQMVKTVYQDLASLAPIENLNHVFLTERLFGLGMAIDVVFNADSTPDKNKGWFPLEDQFSGFSPQWIDMNVALRRLNRYYDQAEAEFLEPLVKYGPTAEDMEANIFKMEEELKNPIGYLKAYLNRAQFMGELFGDYFGAMLVPSLKYAQVLALRADLKNELLKIIAAARLYQMETGAYPETLAALTPKYLASIPKDIFDPKNAPLRYKKTEDGFVVYSVGDNHEDDGGDIDSYNWDCREDYGFEFPLKPKPESEEDEFVVPPRPRHSRRTRAEMKESH